MRRPRATQAQRTHAKVTRANRALCRAAVRYSLASETPEDLAFHFADLNIAADKYTEALPPRERKRVAK